MAISDEDKYKLNTYQNTGPQVNLGDLISDAESVLAGEITLATDSILVGVAGVGSAVDFGSVVTKMQKFSVGFAALNTAGDGVAALFGTAIPDNAIILRTYYDVTTTFAGDGDDSSLISVGLEDQDNDVVVAVAIKTATDWDLGLHEGVQTGTMATALKLTAARQLAVTVDYATTDTTLAAGAMDVYVEYVEGS